MKLSKSGIFLIVVLVIAIGLGVWVAIMTCDVLAKDPITMPDRGSAAGTPRPVQNADKPKEPGHVCHLHGRRLHACLDPDRARF